MHGAAAAFVAADMLEGGSGGEADVHRVRDRPDLLLKVFREEPSTAARERIDRIMGRRHRALDNVAAWPMQWSRVDGRSALLLPLVADAQPIHMFFDRAGWRDVRPNATWATMVEIARNAAIAVAMVHRAGLAVVDISEKNMLVGRDAKVTLIDCDSFVFVDEGIASVSSCFTPGWPAPELGPVLAREPRTANHDNFSLARLIFQLLFAGRAPMETLPDADPDEDRRRFFGYSQLRPIRPLSPADVALSDLPPRVAGYFERAFVEPDQQAGLRPFAEDWAEALTDMLEKLQPCGRQPQHWLAAGGGRSCPWCRIAAAPNGFDSFRPPDAKAAAAPSAGFYPFGSMFSGLTVATPPGLAKAGGTTAQPPATPPTPPPPSAVPFSSRPAAPAQSPPAVAHPAPAATPAGGPPTAAVVTVQPAARPRSGHPLFVRALLFVGKSFVLLLWWLVRFLVGLLVGIARPVLGFIWGMLRSRLGWMALAGLAWWLVHSGGPVVPPIQPLARQSVATPILPSRPDETAERRAVAYAAKFWADLGAPDAPAMIDRTLGSSVDFFGTTLDHARAVQEMDRVVHRWTYRDYKPRLGTTVTDCNSNTIRCSVAFDIDRHLSNNSKNTANVWRGQLEIDTSTSPPLIVSMQGHDLQ